MSTKQEARVASLKELPVGEVRLLQVNGKSIGLFNTGNQIVAVLNICPHAYRPICRGKLGGTNWPSTAGEFVRGGRSPGGAGPVRRPQSPRRDGGGELAGAGR